MTRTLFDDDATLAAAMAVHKPFAEVAGEALGKCIASGLPFSADTIRAQLPKGVDFNPNAMGALFAQARQRRWIVAIDYVKPERRARHGNVNRLWIAGPEAYGC